MAAGGRRLRGRVEPQAATPVRESSGESRLNTAENPSGAECQYRVPSCLANGARSGAAPVFAVPERFAECAV